MAKALRFAFCFWATFAFASLAASAGDSAWQSLGPGLWSQSFTEQVGDSDSDTLFVTVPSASTGIDFVERLDWDHPQGQLFYTGYACGGVAVGDVDGNGLPDLFFAGGVGPNRLYLQRQPWRFVESAATLGIANSGETWSTAATLFDIDNDGDLDLYVCNYDAANQLFVNRGNGSFDERASEYGLDIADASLMASIADYDRDGDLDIYLAMNRYLDERQFRRRDLFYWQDGMEFLRPDAKKYFAIRRYFDRPGQLNMWAGRTDRLLRNEGPGRKFTDQSQQMSLQRGDTLSATWWDYDHNGWPDLYVANDLAAPDRLLRNQQDGSFVDVALTSLPHTPWQAMGASSGDINNDGLVDFLAADMSFRTHFKDKVFMGDMSTKFRNVSVFPHTQLMRNALFVNTGTLHFQEAAYLAGLASTDWTWTAKLADLDNDGRLDAFFTNGSPVNLASSRTQKSAEVEAGVLDTSRLRQQYRDLPPVLEQNLAYRNTGDLQFVDRSREWGLDHVGMSFAAVHADLDLDGDLDLVVANLDDPPLLYRNTSQTPGITIELQGTESNRTGIGAEVVLETSDGQQVRQLFPVAGFQSCQQARVHFGLATTKKIDRLIVRWPSGVEQVFTDVAPGTHYRVKEFSSATGNLSDVLTSKPLFEQFDSAHAIEHHEVRFDDFARQPLLPNRLSQLGPPLAWGDVDNDGDLDLFVGEGSGWMGMIYRNSGDGQFYPQPQIALAQDEQTEDAAAEFFDANGDGHLDLYVGSGSVECDPGSERLRDRLYFGDGKGDFTHAPEAWLPDLRNSTGVVAANDFDHDGDVDLFVGSRSIPGEYPLAPEHALLRNDGDHFTDSLRDIAPELAEAGMITAAAWADVDDDGWDDLLVATDWGPVRLYRNEQGQLVEATMAAGLAAHTGWWQSLATADVDNDGDVDFVAGNFGRNTKYKASSAKPVLAYYGEYGDSGRRNLIEASYEDETLFPLRGKSCSSAAMPHLATRFSTYEKFAAASLAEIYTPECLQKAERFEVNTLDSACFLNNGHGRFEMVPLPTDVQLAPVFAIALTDLNDDGVPDLVAAQNFFGPQRETGPMAGGVGVIALGNGDGTFRTLRPDRAGFVVADDAKSLAVVDTDGDGKREIIIASNDGPMRFYRLTSSGKTEGTSPKQPGSSDWVTRNLAIADRLFNSGQFEECLSYVRRALKVDSEHLPALLLLAAALRERDQFEAAAKLLAKAESPVNAENPQLLAGKGRLQHRLKHFDQAAKLLEAALSTVPDDPQIRASLAEVRLAQGRLQSAREHFVNAGQPARAAEVDEQVQVARVMFEQARRAEQAGEDAEAIRLYEKSLRLDQRSETAQALAKLLETTSNPKLRDLWRAKQLQR